MIRFPKKGLKYWAITVDIITIIWLIHFITSFFTDILNNSLTSFISSFIYIFFIVDLVIIFLSHKSFKRFLKENWIDVMMLLPIFRLFRLFRILKIGKFIKMFRKSKIIKRGHKFVSETFDLGRQIHDRVKRN